MVRILKNVTVGQDLSLSTLYIFTNANNALSRRQADTESRSIQKCAMCAWIGITADRSTSSLKPKAGGDSSIRN